MELHLKGETEDVSVEVLGEGRYRVWADGFSELPPHHRVCYWADVDKTELLSILESLMELSEYHELLELIDDSSNAVAGA